MGFDGRGGFRIVAERQDCKRYFLVFGNYLARRDNQRAIVIVAATITMSR
jgi:hypothetical protein